jgi:hypothetical protein
MKTLRSARIPFVLAVSLITAPAPVLAEPRRVDFIDLVTDIASMAGIEVEVSAVGMPFNGILILQRASHEVAVQVYANIDAIPREQRRKIMDRCGTSCRVTVVGKLGTIELFGRGMIATSVNVR